MRALFALALLASGPAWAQPSPGYPPENVVAGHSGNVANAVATATIAAQATRLNHLTKVVMTAGGATAATGVVCTVTGLRGGTMTFIYGVPLGATINATPLALTFEHPVPATAVNVAIVASCPALGAGNLRAAISAFGFVR